MLSSLLYIKANISFNIYLCGFILSVKNYYWAVKQKYIHQIYDTDVVFHKDHSEAA